VGSNFLAASSFNQPTKLLPSDTGSVTTRSPVTNTGSSFPPKVTTFSSLQLDSRPQSLQATQVRVRTQPATQTQSKIKDPCRHVFHTFLGQKNSSVTNLSAGHAPQLPPANLEGDSSFVNPSNISPSFNLNVQGTENKDSNQGYEYPKPSPTQPATPIRTSTQHPGYVYSPPSKPLEYPKSSLKGDSTVVQTLKTVAPINLTGQSTANRAFLSGVNEFSGYSYQKPSSTFQYPPPTSPSTTARVTIDTISGQGTDEKGNSQDYNYPKAPPNQEITIRPPQPDSHSTSSLSGYNYPVPTKHFQYPEPLLGSLTGEGSKIESRKTFPSVSTNGQSSNENIYEAPNSKDPHATLAEADIRPRLSAETGPARNRTCNHSLPQRAPPSPSEFVRGLSGAASVLAASNELPDKCNHPFLGYVCKRSSDGKIHKK
jgi:hypothetical protein